MKEIVVILLAAIMFSVSVVAAPNVAGVWNIDFKADVADSFDHATCMFVQNDTKLSGTCDEKYAIAGKVDGRTLIWTFKSGTNEEISATFSGQINESGTTINGTFQTVDSSDNTHGTGSFFGTR
jgi:hypothetical protein